MMKCELDMIAAERNSRDLHNPVSVRYSYGQLSGDITANRNAQK